MWNTIRHINNNGKSSALYCHLIQSNLDLNGKKVNINFTNNDENKTIILWQIIKKISTSTTSNTNAKVQNYIASTDNFI